jgi:hypothetical protein
MTPPFDTADRPRATTLGDLDRALRAVEHVLARYEPIHGGRWRRESVYSHVSHLLAHGETWRAERQRVDLEHAACRALMALALALEDAAPPEPAP